VVEGSYAGWLGALLTLKPALSSADTTSAASGNSTVYEPSLLEAERQPLDRWLAARRQGPGAPGRGWLYHKAPCGGQVAEPSPVDRRSKA
jgi:hypothetical protein